MSYTKTSAHKSIFTPPGGLAIWFFITIELLTYAAAIVVFLFIRRSAIDEFNAQQATLNPLLGTTNTLLLITSGFFVAQAVADYKRDQLERSANKLFAGALFGAGFVIIKVIEYAQKIAEGHEVGSSVFFGFYWGLTAFHFIHVLVGLFLLIAMGWQLKRGKRFVDADAGIEAGAAFWHMCDLIWIVIFPLFYILK